MRNYYFRLKFVSLAFFLILSTFISAQKKSVSHPDWSFNKTIYEVNIRQFTRKGTFKSFSEKLPTLKEMGVGIIWFMPIHPIGKLNRKGTLGSYYSVQNYKAVNPEFGTLENFKDIVNQIHDLGMYVIIDWVANHTAWDNIWVKDHPDFYTRDKNGNFVPPVADWSDVIDLNYENNEMRSFMLDAMKFWITECGIDGYRCDVAAMAPTDFWISARTALDSIKPVFMLAEADKPYLHKAFDMTYDWKLKNMMNDISTGKKDADDLYDHFIKDYNEYPEDAYRMNFTTNHDENTWNGTVFERLGDAAEVFNVLISTARGMPLIYSGQETGLNKRLSFFEKDTIIWSDHNYFNLFKKLFRLKKENSALWNGLSGGKMVRINSNVNSDVFAFYRINNENKVIVVLNLSGNIQNIVLDDPALEGSYKDLFSGVSIKLNDRLQLKLNPWKYTVYYK